MKKITIAKIAEKANCSLSTVSRVLNNNPGISETVRAKILKLSESMQYGGSKSSRIVALIAKLDLVVLDTYSFLLLQYLSIELRKRGFKPIIIYNEDLDTLSERFICGAVSLHPFDHIALIWPKLKIKPLVCINDYSNVIENVHSVCSDDKKAINSCVQYFYQKGHGYISLFILLNDTLSCHARIDAFNNTTMELGIKDKAEIIYVQVPLDENEDFSQYESQLSQRCTAVLSCSELISFPLYKKITSKHKNISFIAWAYPTENIFKEFEITTLSQNYYSLAVKAIDILERKIKNDLGDKNSLLAYNFFERKSVFEMKND